MQEEFCFRKAWQDKLRAFQKTWFCKKCGRWCPNCAGRSCAKCCIKHLDAGHFLFTDKELKDTSMYGQTHPESLFAIRRKEAAPFGYSVGPHPKWRRDFPNPIPLSRPPWPWEQPRYEPNMRFPTTYVSPAEYREWEEIEAERESTRHNFGVEVPPLSYHLTRYYKSTHPQYVLRY